MIDFGIVHTMKNFRVMVYRPNKGHSNMILLKDFEEHYNINPKGKSLTNNIEEVLEHILLGTSFERTHIRFFQYGDDGLFEILYGQEPCPHRGIAVFDVKWKFISDDIKTFEVLYCG